MRMRVRRAGEGDRLATMDFKSRWTSKAVTLCGAREIRVLFFIYDFHDATVQASFVDTAPPDTMQSKFLPFTGLILLSFKFQRLPVATDANRSVLCYLISRAIYYMRSTIFLNISSSFRQNDYGKRAKNIKPANSFLTNCYTFFYCLHKGGASF